MNPEQADETIQQSGNAASGGIQQSVENYELLEIIGRGGMSVVYSARDRLLGRKVAIKFLNQELGQEKNKLERFVNEARASSALRHPNIIEILAFGISKKGEPYMIMEYLEGKTLDSLMQAQKLSLLQFREIFLPVLDALAFAHEKSFIHRDIKPGNIMILDGRQGEPGGVKLLDFGIAKNLNSMSKKQQLTTGLLGTPKYISPEQCAGSAADYRSDVYSLACIMYEAIVGEVPFESESAMQTMYRRMTQSLATISRFTSTQGFSLNLLNTIVKALSKNPEQRPQNAAEFRTEILKALNIQAKEQLPNTRSLAAKTVMFLLCIVPFVCLGLLIGNSWKGKPQELMNKKSKLVPGAIGTRVTGVRQASILNQAYILSGQGLYKEAEPIFKEAIARAEQTQSDDRLEWLYSAHLALGQNYLAQKQGDLAYKEVLKAADVFDSPTANKRLRAFDTAAEYLFLEGKTRQSLDLLTKTCATAEAESPGQALVAIGDSYYALAVLLERANKLETALRTLNKAVWHYEHSEDGYCRPNSVKAAFLYYKLCRLLGKDMQAAELELEKSRKQLLADKQETARVSFYFGQGLEELGRPNEAIKYYQQGLEYAKYRDSKDCKIQSADENRKALYRLKAAGISLPGSESRSDSAN